MLEQYHLVFGRAAKGFVPIQSDRGEGQGKILHPKVVGSIPSGLPDTFGVADRDFFYGLGGDIPLAGDWNGDGCDTLAIYRPSQGKAYIRKSLGTGVADFEVFFGNPGDRPFAGDFDGEGVTTVGLYQESTGFVYFRNTLETGVADFQFFYGEPSDRIVTGDWDENDRHGRHLPPRGCQVLLVQ